LVLENEHRDDVVSVKGDLFVFAENAFVADETLLGVRCAVNVGDG